MRMTYQSPPHYYLLQLLPENLKQQTLKNLHLT